MRVTMSMVGSHISSATAINHHCLMPILWGNLLSTPQTWFNLKNSKKSMLREKKPCCLTVIGVSETLQWGRVTHMQAMPYPTSSFIWTQERIQTTIFRHWRTQLLTPVLTLQSPFCKSTHNISGLCKRGGLSPTCARSEGLPLKSDAVLKSWRWVAMAASWEECHVSVLPTPSNINIKMTSHLKKKLFAILSIQSNGCLSSIKAR